MAKIRYISAQELKQLYDTDEVLVCDIREHDEFNREHIRGAVNMPLSKFDPEQLAIAGESMGHVAIHCQSGNRTKINEAKFAQINREEVLIVDGGISAWKSIGCIVNKNTKAPLPIMRQVQIVAGSLIMLGVLLGYFVSPGFFLLSGFVGAGLTFAGVTGFCGMANLLMLLPYNKKQQCGVCQ